MIILHAGVFKGEFMLWGEAAPETPAKAKRSSKSKTISDKTVWEEGAFWPYDAGVKRFSAALKAGGITFSPTNKRLGRGFIWLPTAGKTAIASSALIAEPHKSQAKARLAPWAVTVFSPALNKTIDFLCACVGKHMLGPGVIVGDDLAFWTSAMRFAGALAAKQRFLPHLDNEDGVYHACWEAVIKGNDAKYFTNLAKGMPASARAFSDKNTTSSPDLATSSVLSDFINDIVDHLIRSAAQEPTPIAGKHKLKGSDFDSVHDQWLYALQTPKGIMAGDEAELEKFAFQVQEWRRPIAVSTASAFKLCFRLEEPSDRETDKKQLFLDTSYADDKWNVSYLLQAADDPSLLLPVADVWDSEGHKLFHKDNFNAKEYVLSSLGQAASICPLIEESLKTPIPTGYELDTTGAYGFLTDKAIVLEQAGFGVMLPAWWTNKGTKQRLNVSAGVNSPKLQGGGGLSLGEIVQFDWEVAIGDEKLSLKELEMLAKLKSPLVKVRGQWVEMSGEEIQAALNFWKKKASGKATVRDIVQMALGAKDSMGGFSFSGVNATGWIDDLLAQLEGRTAFEELPAPENFQGELRPYQLRGYSWLAFLQRWGLGACLADDMGLGKTVQALALIQNNWETNGKSPTLIICPTSVMNNWQKEAARFTPNLPVTVHHGISREKGKGFKKVAQKQAIVISSYALLHRDIKLFRDVSWFSVILDEAQNIKNSETKQAKAARSLNTDYRIALTGTPVENNVGDLWSIMEFLNSSFLGTQTEFKRNFFVPIQARNDVEAAKKLKRITSPFILRRLKTDKSIITDLPDKMEMKVFCNLTKEQASLYSAVVKDVEQALDSKDGIQRKGIILATLSKLKQVCNHPAQFLGDNSKIPGRSGKLARLFEMLEEIIEVGDRALIFSQFSEMGGILQRYLQEQFGSEVLFLHGALTRKKRDSMIERFQSGDEDSPRIFILSLKAGGTGLNLTRANHVFHFDRWWNPAVENQATDRAFRIGQTKDVQVHKFICAGTLEDKIDEMIERKKEIAENVVGTGEGWLTEMSNEELKNIFALRKDAVG